MTRGGGIGPLPGGVSGWVVGLAVAVAGCSDFDGANERLPELEADTRSLNGTAGGMGSAMANGGADWSCLDDPVASNPDAASFGAGTVTYSIAVRSLFGAPITNVSTKVCLPADPTCATPLSEARGLSPDGQLVLQVPHGFNGFLEVLMDGHVPSVFYMRKPVLRDTNDPLPLLPIPTAGVQQLAMLFNSEFVPELGLIGIGVVDCRGDRAPGVSFTNNLGGRAFYFEDGLPNLNASTTDAQGLGGFFNVPTRLTEVTAQVQVSGHPIGTRSVLARPGWVMLIQVRPPALPLD